MDSPAGLMQQVDEEAAQVRERGRGEMVAGNSKTCQTGETSPSSTDGKKLGLILNPSKMLSALSESEFISESDHKTDEQPEQVINNSAVKFSTYSVRESENSNETLAEAAKLKVWTRKTTTATIKPTSKRYFILFMFCVLQTIKSFQWICLASITNVAAKFYGVDNLAINWTTILFMVTFLVLAMPVSWIINSIGLRRAILTGTFGVTLGVVIKCFSFHRAGFATSMFGHLIVGLCEPFFFSSYSQLASVWFPDHQVALATSVSLIGERLGIAFGFIIPPLVVGNDSNNFAAIQSGLFKLFLAVASISILNTICIVLFFHEEPKFSPGIARQKQKENETVRRQSFELELERKRKRKQKQSQEAFRQRRASSTASNVSLRLTQTIGGQLKLSAKLLSSRHFLLLLTGFGLNQGISYSSHTLLNQMIVQAPSSSGELLSGQAWPLLQANVSISGGHSVSVQARLESDALKVVHKEPVADRNDHLVVGSAGLIMIGSGLFGSAFCGFALDRYHSYKLATVLIYLISLCSMAALTASLLLQSPAALYLAIIPLGFAEAGYASCAFDYAVELTYPKPELLSSTLLNMSAQIFGIPISLVGSLIVDAFGSLALGGFFCALHSVGFVVTCLQGGELRRRTAINGDGGYF